MLKLVEFIKSHSDWEQILSDKPYFIKIVKDGSLVIFKYDQIHSDFNNEIVRECRGIILEEGSWKPVCVPFFKFGNYGESYAPDIDWTTAKVTEKLDGSLYKIVRYNGKLLYSTNGTIDAFKAPLVKQLGCSAENFGDLIILAIQKTDVNIDNFIKDGYTYMFELTSPFNKVVVQWNDIELHFLGARDNETLQEYLFNEPMFKELADMFTPPKIFALSSLNDCIEAAKVLAPNNEGYVVVDSNFNRIKVKSPTYVALHHLKGNDAFTLRRCIEIVKNNEIDEIMTYFPEFTKDLTEVKSKYDAFVKEIKDAWNIFMSKLPELPTRKDQALYIQKIFKVPAFAFLVLNKKAETIDDAIKTATVEKLEELLS